MRRQLRSTLAVLACLSCSDGGSPETPAPMAVNFDYSGMLDHLGSQVVLPTYERFVGDTQALTAAVADYCSALGTEQEQDALAAARSAWTAAIATWQKAELMSIGPAATDGLRDLIYSWPIVSACAVDQDVVRALEAPEDFAIETRLPNRRGLDAAEYLLYAANLDSVCPPQAQPASWATLSDQEKRAARCQYASLVADDLLVQASTLTERWRADGGGYAAELAGAGQPGSQFSTAEAAVNAVFGALFYLDTKTKDAKLGRPAGLLANVCGTLGEPCPQELESKYAARSKEHIVDNLIGFEWLFFGTISDGSDGPGFDDLLRAAGAEQVAARLAEETSQAKTAVADLPGTLAEALEADLDKVVEAHSRVRQVTTTLKQDVPDLLGLEIPGEAGGDTD
jgi:uncharacterized protein